MRETTSTITGNRPSPLKINGDSHRIHKQRRHHQPVIIYVHSPKVIHTLPHDFMALVQKLTGLNRFDEQEDQAHNDSASSETLNSLQDDSQMKNQNDHQHPYFSDVPMFTPSSVDHNNLICSPSSLFGSISPSMFKFIQGLPEY